MTAGTATGSTLATGGGSCPPASPGGLRAAIGAAPATSSVFQFCFPAVGPPGEMDAPLRVQTVFLAQRSPAQPPVTAYAPQLSPLGSALARGCASRRIHEVEGCITAERRSERLSGGSRKNGIS